MAAPHFTDRVDEAEAIVRDRSQSPQLVDADRELLINTLRSLRRSVGESSAPEQLLHGEPHGGIVLRDCRILKLAMIAAWRADRADVFPNGREMRDEMLRDLREALDHHHIEVRH